MKRLYKERLVKNKTVIGQNWLRSMALRKNKVEKITSEYAVDGIIKITPNSAYVSNYSTVSHLSVKYKFGVAVNFVI